MRCCCCGERGCEYTFTNLFAWSGPYQLQVAEVEGCLTASMTGAIGPCYLYPVGATAVPPCWPCGPTRRRGDPLPAGLSVRTAPSGAGGLVSGCFAYGEDRDGYDYLYDIGRLASWPGKKLHGKRNHINKFLSTHPVWSVEPITPDNLSDCLAMNRRWHRKTKVMTGEKTFEEDGAALENALPTTTAWGWTACCSVPRARFWPSPWGS